MMKRIAWMAWVIGIVCTACAGAEKAPWRTGLELGGGDLWQRRIAIAVRNESDQALAGEPIQIRVGKQAGQIDLEGAQAEQIRACGAEGPELLWRLIGPDRKPVTRGAVAAGSTLTLPVEAGPRSSATMYVYFDNASAWAVPEMLEGSKASGAKVAEEVGAVETIGLKMPAGGAMRPAHGAGAPVLVPNLISDERKALVHVEVPALTIPLGDPTHGMRVIDGASNAAAEAVRIGDGVLFEAQVAARSAGRYLVVAGEKGAQSDVAFEKHAAGAANLVKNAGFEQGASGSLQGWSVMGSGEVVAKDAKFGAAWARVVGPDSPKPAWVGLRQDVPARAGRKYLYGAWVKCSDVDKGSVLLHGHWLKADGKQCAKNAFVSAGAANGQGLKGTTPWTLLSRVIEAPADAATFQVHLTTNTAGTIGYDGVIVAEVMEGLVGDPTSGTAYPKEGCIAWPVNPIVKVFRHTTPEASATTAAWPARISAARNELEALQVAFRSEKALKQVSVSVEAPVNASGAKLSDVSINVVGYVPIDHKTNYYRSEATAWQRRVPGHGASSDGWAGWWPDPLLPASTFDVEAQTTRPVWITVAVPRGAAAGEYQGKVKFSTGGVLIERPFIVRVWDFELPDVPRVKAVYDLRVGNSWLRDPKDNREKTDRWRQLSSFMAKRRLCPDRISPEPSIKYENGKVIADFTEYDKAAEEYFKLGHTHTYTPRVFYGFGWAHPPAKFMGVEPYEEGKYPYEGIDRGKLSPRYKQAYQACLKAYLDHMRAKGWYDKVLLYISDEPHFWKGSSWGGKEANADIVPQMKAICTMIHEVDPKLPIYSSTWWHVPAWDGFITAWGVGIHGIVPEAKLAEIQQGGARVIWTTDGHMCTDTPYCGVERMLPHFCFKYGVEGYEFWGATWLTYNPYEFGWHKFIRQADKPGHDYYIRYPNGDGYLIYPGVLIGKDEPVSSIRLEQAREGVDDYDYLWTLRQRIAAAKAAGKDTSVGQKVLDDAAKLVVMPNPGGRFSMKILPRPDAILELKEAAGRAIEGLR